jgi:hypothetical protein
VTIWGGLNDTIVAGFGDNETVGGVPSDTIFLNSGNAFVDGSQGGQSIIKGFGGNQIIWGALTDTIQGGSGGNETIAAAAGETVIGGNANTFIDASAGNASVIAGGGATSIWGGSGDTIQGAVGNGLARVAFAATGGAETLWDNGPTPNFGQDTVFGFNHTRGDIISVPTGENVSGVLASAHDVSGGVQFTLDDGVSVTLIGITAAQLDATYFTTH